MNLSKYEILEAMVEYDKSRRSNFSSGTGYAILFKKKHYPPKEIFSLCTNLPVAEFNSLKARRVFEKLGFTIVKAESSKITAKKSISPVELLKKSNKEITDILFKKTWISLEDWKKSNDLKLPGVYIIAFTNKDLEHKPISAKDVFYVGMTHSGLKNRLDQFMKGITVGDGHSGGNRFFEEYLDSKPWSGSSKGKKLYINSIALSCETKKDKRTVEDLLIMGRISDLEFHCLARVKLLTGKEPELNKK